MAKKKIIHVMAASALVMVLSACSLVPAISTTGNAYSFDLLTQANLQPGVTSFNEVVEQLGAEPMNIYRQVDGSYTARWAHKKVWLTDGIYKRKELWLRFDVEDTFLSIQHHH